MCKLTEIFSGRIVSSQNFGKAAVFYLIFLPFLNDVHCVDMSGMPTLSGMLTEWHCQL